MFFSMNGFRRSLTEDLNELGEALNNVLDGLHDSDAIELKECFDRVACSANSLNCVSLKGDEHFSDMSDAPEVKLLGNYED